MIRFQTCKYNEFTTYGQVGALVRDKSSRQSQIIKKGPGVFAQDLTPILKNRRKGTETTLYTVFYLFLREKFLNLRLLHEKFIENVSTSLWRLVHTNALYHFLTALTGSEGCDRFLCHSLILLRYLISR